MESTKTAIGGDCLGNPHDVWLDVGLAFGPSVIAVLTISLYIPPIEQEFGWSRVQVSLAFTIVAYLIVLMSPLQGFLVDRFGPRRVVLTSIPLFAASLAALYFMPANLTCITCSGRLVPIAGLGLWPLGYLQAVTPWFDRKLGLSLGCANAGIGVGSTLLPMLVIGPIIAAYSWRHALLDDRRARAVRELADRRLLRAGALGRRRRGAQAARRGRSHSACPSGSGARADVLDAEPRVLPARAHGDEPRQPTGAAACARRAGRRTRRPSCKRRSASVCCSRASPSASSSITFSRRA